MMMKMMVMMAIVDNYQSLFVLLTTFHYLCCPFRSRPVLKVSANVTFSPPKISSDRFVCLTEMESISNIVNLTVCFNVTASTENATGKQNSTRIQCTTENWQ